MKKIISLVSAIFILILTFVPGSKDISKKSQETLARDTGSNGGMKH